MEVGEAGNEVGCEARAEELVGIGESVLVRDMVGLKAEAWCAAASAIDVASSPPRG